ncbi:uncharacterized protein LOC112685695 [Sipha flava]|uniref:Uncharacterized protein LOC112685695 n=1 Tax=Sipha flava TaxID=143950 RepID=A0A8B8FRN8_9HEMI|nr:uncharacterized protein LOC112685695 [Sipha flava]
MSIRPYSFEPTVNDIDMADIQPGTNEPDIGVQLEGRSKMNVNDWCICNKCIRFTIKTCDHDPLTNEEINNKLWLKSDDESYYALKKVITAKDFIKDLPHAKHFVHTGRLESYHNVRLKYMPKRIHLKYRGMYIRSILAILDHNYNTNKQLVGDKMVYSKPLGKYTIKNVYERTDTDWRKQIMHEVLDLAKKKQTNIAL